MTNRYSTDEQAPEESTPADASPQLGFWLSISTAVLTAVTFGLALTAIPNSGRNCRADCVTYPFASEVVAEQFPRDYLWMLPAMVLMLLFVGLVACIHHYAPQGRRIFSLIGLSVAVVAAAVLLIDYFIQLTVMPPSLEKGQLEGWPLFTQYNPNGVFLALEELGFLLMSVVFLAIAPVFVGPDRLERTIRWLFVLSFAATMVALVAVSVLHGFDRQDTFEIAAISVVWLTLIVSGPLLAMAFKRAIP